MVAGGLLFGRRGGLQSLGVGGEVLAAVGGVEAFGENDERGSGFGSFEDAGTSAGEVGGFVGTWGGWVREGRGGSSWGEVGRTCLLRAARVRASRVS